MTFSEIYSKAEVRRLPVDPIAVAAALRVKVMDYKAATEFFDIEKSELYRKCPLGFSFMENGVFCIALNENSCGDRRRRFTAAHELAHCVLGHLNGGLAFPRNERAAERFAAELLAPLAVLSACRVRSPEAIARLCGISAGAAEIRSRQLAERERGGFFASGDEQRVLALFGDFINRHRENR